MPSRRRRLTRTPSVPGRSHVEFRRLAPDDLRAVWAASHLYDDPPDAVAASAYLADERNLFLVAFVGRRAVGFLRGTCLNQPHTARPQMFLYEIEVERPYRKRGIGAGLVREFLAASRERDCEEAFVFTDPANRAAVRLYRSTGAVTETPADRMYVYRLNPASALTAVRSGRARPGHAVESNPLVPRPNPPRRSARSGLRATRAIRIVPARTDPDRSAARRLLREYRDWLSSHREVTAFDDAILQRGIRRMDREIRGLPGEYGTPRGEFVLAFRGRVPVGCAGLRRLTERTAEIKRVYVRPGARGGGVGTRLVGALMQRAGRLGYRRIRLDTLPGMEEAIEMYRRLGFREIPRYWDHPVPGALFFEYELRRGPPAPGSVPRRVRRSRPSSRRGP